MTPPALAKAAEPPKPEAEKPADKPSKKKTKKKKKKHTTTTKK